MACKSTYNVVWVYTNLYIGTYYIWTDGNHNRHQQHFCIWTLLTGVIYMAECKTVSLQIWFRATQLAHTVQYISQYNIPDTFSS